MANNLLGNYPHLKETLQTSINQIHHIDCSLEEIELEEVEQCSLTANTTLRVKLIWSAESDDELLPRRVMLQVPNTDEQSSTEHGDAMQSNIKKYNIEVEFYALFKVHSETEVPLPCCYAAEKQADRPGLLVLEDLTDQGVFIEDISTGMTIGQLFSVTAALANFHSWFLRNRSDWQSKLNIAHEDVLQLRDTMEAGLKQMKSEYPDRCAEVKFDLIMEKFTAENIAEWSDRICKSIPIVLTRKELWTNSVLFRKRSDGTPGDDLVAIVNWQTIGKGTLLEDICYLLSWCATADTRRKYERILMVYYRKKLEQGVDGSVQLPDNDSFWKAYKETFWLRGLMLLGMIPTLLSNPASNEGASNEEKKVVMLERAIACYNDSLAFLNEDD